MNSSTSITGPTCELEVNASIRARQVGRGLRGKPLWTGAGVSRSVGRSGVGHHQRKTDPAAIPRASESVASARLVTLRLSLLSWGRNCWPQGQSHKGRCQGEMSGCRSGSKRPPA
jgi:hypothetical protein